MEGHRVTPWQQSVGLGENTDDKKEGSENNSLKKIILKSSARIGLGLIPVAGPTVNALWDFYEGKIPSGWVNLGFAAMDWYSFGASYLAREGEALAVSALPAYEEAFHKMLNYERKAN